MTSKILRTKTLTLARQADFCMWNGECWGPEVEAVDWSVDYDEELVKLVQLVVRECASLCDHTTKQKILNHFDI